jgi:E3 ubiquitin-protein ligase MYCBP2
VRVRDVCVMCVCRALGAQAEATRGGGTHSEVCRFCGVDLTAENRALDAPAPALERVCNAADCVAKRNVACVCTLDCGHLCGGVRDETTCLPCYEGCSGVKLVADEDCTVCYTEHLVASPTIRLGCGHAFHYMCLTALLSRRWSGPRINFGFLACPLCRKELDHPALAAALAPVLKLRQQVRVAAAAAAAAAAHADPGGRAGAREGAPPPPVRGPGQVARDHDARREVV